MRGGECSTPLTDCQEQVLLSLPMLTPSSTPLSPLLRDGLGVAAEAVMRPRVLFYVACWVVRQQQQQEQHQAPVTLASSMQRGLLTSYPHGWRRMQTSRGQGGGQCLLQMLLLLLRTWQTSASAALLQWMPDEDLEVGESVCLQCWLHGPVRPSPGPPGGDVAAAV